MLKQELKYFLTAVMFFSRIPIPKWVGYSQEQLNASTKYFPLVGVVIGGVGALSLWGFLQFLPTFLAVLLSMVLTIYITGAFHEDGFADFCDGYGGGYTKERILTIMKDSRLGTYGTIGLLAMLASKFFGLNYLTQHNVALLLLAAHVISRIPPVFLIYSSEYVSENDTSKSKPVGKGIQLRGLLFSLLFALPLWLFVAWQIMAVYVLSASLVFFVFKRYVEKKTDGYTGDVLGALQQISELLFYLVAVVIYYNQWI